MDQQIISLMVALFVLLGFFFLFLYVGQTKHGSRLSWKAFVFCSLIVCGSAFVAGFFLASLTEPASYALANAFRLDRATSVLAAKLTVNLMAALAVSPAGLWIVRKMIRREPTLNS